MDRQIISLLNVQIANMTVLYMKLHHYHWFIKGAHFYQLHELFQNLYEDITLDLDMVAERILILGDRPISTLSECLSLTRIPEANGINEEKQMIETLIQDYQLLNREVMEIITLCKEDNDEVTLDILIGIKSKLDKHNWMLTSLLK